MAFSTVNTPDKNLTVPGESGHEPIAENFQAESIKNESIYTFFYAVVEATEEAILYVMVGARDELTGWKGGWAERTTGKKGRRTAREVPNHMWDK